MSGKIGKNSLFGGKYKAIKDKTVHHFWLFVGSYAVKPQNSTKKIHFRTFFGQKGPGTGLKCEKIWDSTSVKIPPSLSIE